MKNKCPGLRYGLIVVAVLLLALSGGCAKKVATEVEKLVLITPHHETIREEFGKRFVKYCEEKLNKKVELEWRDVGGGSSTILSFIRNVYAKSDSSGIDILFGGGEYPCQYLAVDGLLTPLELQADILENIPAEFCGMPLYDRNKLWCGNVLSAFGILYNKKLCERYNLAPPRNWDDLGQSGFYDMIVLADPTQSGSSAATYEMIVQTGSDWPAGWAKLMLILSNAKKFTHSSSDSANAPMSEAIASTTIDFYGVQRVLQAPEILVYINPVGQTGFTPDPVAILKNPPHRQLSQAFVNFLLSVEGQAIWGLSPGTVDGPQRNELGRIPIRKDFYTRYQKNMPKWLENPYESGASMQWDSTIREVRYGVMAQLVRAAAVENLELMKKARKKLIDNPQNSAAAEKFFKLPENMDTREEVFTIAEDLKDTIKAEKIITGWISYYQDTYRSIIEQ